jgi:FixJ family two-component response regulator
VDAIPVVAVVDDDESVRESLGDLLRTLGFDPIVHASARSFLASGQASRVSCVLLDVAMPDMSGPALFDDLRRRGEYVPVVFITAHGDESTRRRLLEQGAAECLFKPFDDVALLAALKKALGDAGDR